MEQRLIDANDLEERVSETTWYHINKNGELVEGAEDRHSALYKAEDIYRLIDNALTVEVTDYDTGYQDGLEDGLNDIRPQGEWLLNKDGNPECPFCHYSFTYWGNFCGNCGADMRGEENAKT